MGDLDINGKEEQVKERESKEPTEVQTKRKPTEPPPAVKSGFEYVRGNYDTSVITLLASINANIVKQTEILKKVIEDGRSAK